MSNYYNLNGIRTDINKTLETAIALKELWENVTFPTKKNGEPFAILSKNINGASIKHPAYEIQPGEDHLSVTGWEKNNGYFNDEINIYCLVKDLKDEKRLRKTENYLPKINYLEQVYKYDLEDIKQAVSDRIIYFENRIISLTKQLEKLDNAFNAFKIAYGKALEDLKENCDTNDLSYSNGTNDLYHAILETVKQSFLYC